MKKILTLGVLTLGLVAATERPAQAWVNSKFSVGLNWHLQSGGNNFLWGVFRNGQVPGPETFNQGGPFTPPGYQQGPGGFQYYGAAPAMQNPAASNGVPNAMSSQAFGAIPTWSNQNYFQNVNYVPSYWYPQTYYQPTYQQYGW
ncbi:MAG: hypothetical protein U0744_05580 [Gemmataceae bacterium]